MIIPEELVQKLLCSICFKYLSVGPIKVYPNRQIKCGRCFQQTDEGTESLLYTTIAKCLLFPCINRFDGCKEVLGISDMKYHEDTCKEGEYQCPLCDNFKGSGYNFNFHLRRYHQGDTLYAKEFLIDLQKGSQEENYLYGKDILLFFITSRYDATTHKLFLNTAYAGKNVQGDVTQRFALHDTDNTLKYATNIQAATKFGLEVSENFEINISSLGFANDIVVCKFFVKEKPLLQLQPSSQIIDGLENCAVIRCRFEKVSDYTGWVVYPTKFLINSITFEVSIYIEEIHTVVRLKATDIKDGKEFFMSAKFTLFSSQAKEYSDTEENFVDNSGTNWSLVGCFYLSKKDLINPDNGFVKNDAIVVEIRCYVILRNKNSSCVYCDSCKKCKKTIV